MKTPYIRLNMDLSDLEFETMLVSLYDLIQRSDTTEPRKQAIINVMGKLKHEYMKQKEEDYAKAMRNK